MKEKMSQTVERIRPKLEAKVPPRERDRHLQELPKGEELFRHTGQGNPGYPDLIRVLTKIYNVLNRQLGIICRELDYPPNQAEWKDGRPLDVMRWVWEGIALTNWYQWQLGQMLSQQNHPWVNIIMTSEIKTASLFPDLDESTSTSKSKKSSPAEPMPPKP